MKALFPNFWIGNGNKKNTFPFFWIVSGNEKQCSQPLVWDMIMLQDPQLELRFHYWSINCVESFSKSVSVSWNVSSDFPLKKSTRPIKCCSSSLTEGILGWSMWKHLCFKQAQPNICHSPKVEDIIENHFFLFFFPIFL